MPEYKKHHHVPEFILHNFKGAEGLFYFNKKFPKNGIQVRNPKSIFRIPHLYSYREKDGKINRDVESKHFKKVDDDAALVVKKIISDVRMRRLPNLSSSEKKKWDTFFINQFARSADRLLSGELHEYADELFNKEINFLTNFLGEDHPSLVSFLSETDVKERMNDMVIKKSLMKDRDDSNSMKILGQRGLIFGNIVRKKSFIIGSSPLVRFSNSGTNHLTDPKTEWWYPISHDIAVSIGSTLPMEKEKLLFLDQRQTNIIRRFNKSIANQSNEVASKSFPLLKSILMDLGFGKYINT